MGKNLIKWSEEKLYKGYHSIDDAHHGPELFLGFLPRFIKTFPENQKAKDLLINAAEFIGNWKKNYPKWFDYENNCFFITL